MTRLTAQQIEDLPEWMTIPDYPSYEVNCRVGLLRNAMTLRVLKPRLGTRGYPQIHLNRDGKAHSKNLHRIVATAAFGYYNISTDGLCVCHLDEERFDARVSNLALGTAKENANFPKAKQRSSEAKKGKRLSEGHRKKIAESNKGKKNYWFGKHLNEEHRKKIAEAAKRKRYKRVGAYKNGELIMVFQSTAEAGRNGFNQGNISSCCTGRRRVYKGYQWRFLDTTDTTTALYNN